MPGNSMNASVAFGTANQIHFYSLSEIYKGYAMRVFILT